MTTEHVVDEALRLIQMADDRGIRLRLLGGVAIAAVVPELRARADRPGRDIDLATERSSRRAIAQLLEAEGYTPDRRYNGMNGHKQLYFVDVERSRPVDVLIDRMEMCHSFSFVDRLGGPGPALPVADLLLSKLQIAKINRKDLLDAFVLFGEFPLVATGSAGIEVARIVSHTSSDWGWWRTVTGNLDLLGAFMAREPSAIDLELGRPLRLNAAAQVAELSDRINGAPKTLSWRVRAKVGERVSWYEEPEEETHE